MVGATMEESAMSMAFVSAHSLIQGTTVIIWLRILLIPTAFFPMKACRIVWTLTGSRPIQNQAMGQIAQIIPYKVLVFVH